MGSRCLLNANIALYEDADWLERQEGGGSGPAGSELIAALRQIPPDVTQTRNRRRKSEQVWSQKEERVSVVLACGHTCGRRVAEKGQNAYTPSKERKNSS